MPKQLCADPDIILAGCATKLISKNKWIIWNIGWKVEVILQLIITYDNFIATKIISHHKIWVIWNSGWMVGMKIAVEIWQFETLLAATTECDKPNAWIIKRSYRWLISTLFWWNSQLFVL